MGLKISNGNSFVYQDKAWLRQQYFIDGKRQKQIANECGCKQVTISKWLNIHFTKEELKEVWHYDGLRPWQIGEGNWIYKHPEHPFVKRLKEVYVRVLNSHRST